MVQGRTGPRLSFQESMDLVPLPPKSGGSPEHPTGSGSGASDQTIRRYMSTRAAWVLSLDLGPLPEPAGESSNGDRALSIPKAAFGGHVYSQSGLAACLAVEEDEMEKGKPAADVKTGLHTIHGHFTERGLHDRPFFYEVSTLASNPAFSTRLVTARQPREPSPSPEQDHFTPERDGSAPLGPVCFSAVLSFKMAEPHSNGVSSQEPSPWARFASVLSQRRPEEWPPSPPVDIDAVVAGLGNDIVGTFPMVEVRKVDMTAYNASLGAAAEAMDLKRELILYRLLAPLPADTAAEANRHVLVHAYLADKNGLLMMGNLLGFGFAFGRAASLSYSFVVHTNVEEAAMRHHAEPGARPHGEWWVQEACFPRTGHGRGIVLSKIWSPDGVHVATGYQDGLCRARNENAKQWWKL